MLSTKYRLRLESICKDIASGTEVTLEDMIWAEKLAKAKTKDEENDNSKAESDSDEAES